MAITGRLTGIVKMLKLMCHFKKGALRIPISPIYIYLEPTDHCNYKCIICPHSMSKENGWNKGYISIELFQSIVMQLKEMRPFFGVSLHLGGEPLLHTQLEQMIMIGRQNGIRFGLSTNGSLLTKDRIKSIVDSGLGGVGIDFTAKKELYNQVCVGGSWEKVYNNICNLIEYRDLARPGFKVKLKDLALESNITAFNRQQSMEDLRRCFARKRVDQFDTFEIHNWSGDFASKNTEIGRMNTIAGGGAPFPCSHLWYILSIKNDGRVVPCCRDVRGDMVLGNVNRDTLFDIWNGDAYKKIRQLHIEKRFEEIPLCKDCDRIWTGGKRGGRIRDIIVKHFKIRSRKIRYSYDR
jgi:radical SAM protein with 4Fe4S-binding SPASM domain